MQIPVVQAVNIDLIDMGTKPLRIGGVKAYQTDAEEGMLEVTAQWGSNARVRVSARLGFAGYCVNIPVEVRDIQVGRQQAVLSDHSSLLVMVSVTCFINILTMSMVISVYLSDDL